MWRVFVGWFVLSCGLLAWRHHQQEEKRATLQFTVFVEGRTERPLYHAELNELRYDSGERSGLGRKQLTIQTDGAEPFVTNFFVWYGGKNLEAITLARSRGLLELSLTSPARQVGVSNQETSKVLSNTTRESLSLPTGRYRVTAQFARFTTEREVDIAAKQTSRLAIDPGLTALAVASQPTNAEIELTSLTPKGISIRSNTPVTLTHLPSGDYHLRLWRGDYQKTVPLTLTASAGTNELKVEFDYAQIAIHSEPAGASIRHGEKVMGTTPASLTLPTGLYRLTVEKEGFSSTNFALTLQTKDERTVEVQLVNLVYLTALRQAREHASGNSPDFESALEEVNRALQIKPHDKEVLALKQSILFNKHLNAARELRHQQKFAQGLSEVEKALLLMNGHADALDLKRELEQAMQSAAQARVGARRIKLATVFQDRVSRQPNSELFPAQKMTFKGEPEAARAALVRAMGRNPAWKIYRNDSSYQDTLIIEAESKSIGSRQNVYFVVGLTDENTVEVHFKLFLYTLSSQIKIGLGGISDDSFKPLHPSQAPAEQVKYVETRRLRFLEDLKKRLGDEFH